MSDAIAESVRQDAIRASDVSLPGPGIELVDVPVGSDPAIPAGAFLHGHQLGDIKRSDAALVLAVRALLVVVALALMTPLPQEGLPAALLLLIGASWLLVLQMAPSVLPPGVGLGAIARTVVRAIAMVLVTAVLVAVVPAAVLPGEQLIRAGALLMLLSIPLELWLDTRRTPMRVLVVGRGGGGADVARSLSASPRQWSLVGLVEIEEGDPSGNGNHGENGYPGSSAGTEELLELAELGKPNLVVLAESPGRDAALDLLLAMRRPSFRIVSLDHFLEFACGRISIWRVTPLWFMGLLHAYGTPYRAVTKRFFDLLMSTFLLLLTWPLLAVIAVLVRVSSHGPILYRQTRVGEAGETFEMLKFRTMTNAAESDGQEVWAAVDDARITRVGRPLRRYRLDELPQIVNIMRGDMSFVGPRPERPDLANDVQAVVPHWSRRLMVRPGVTGWAQVCHGYTADEMAAAEKLAYDLFYVKHQSLAFDLAIVLKTFGVVLRRSGSR